eukprot:CAMPEP_0203747172 /NCGR_PEP_ID=MMETSP0098-20131031/2403_1 /ASSEMBLY_ACC=CAM_ASM_000208 /TAXON_ID=96639 /ORGANISM=" , Strain NY0313808BC1" /LENGTH=425 /DNA_ID=CAMNT_0050635525 /DNA_START=69 /DNA_END=1346 /DNA_ORIENTATION=-
MNPFDDIHHGAGAMQPAGINPFDAICIEERPTRISPPIPPRPVLTQCERPAPRRNPPQRRVQHPKPPPKPEPSAPPPPESLGLFEEAHTSVSVVSMDEEELNCPICFEMFCTVAPRVVYCCTCCKHSFCKPCIFDSLQRTGNTCPMCRNHMPQPARNFDLERTLANVPGFCKECGLSMPTSKLDEHESTCNGQHDNNNTANNNFWECQRCTFHNKLTEESCEMCLASNTTQQHTASNTPTTQQPIALHIPCATVVNQPAAQPRGQILLRVSSKKIFRKWKPCYYSIDGFKIYFHDIHTQNATKNNAFKAMHIHSFMCLERITKTEDVIVEKQTERGTKRIVRKVSNPTEIYKSRLFENPLSSVAKYDKVVRNAKFINSTAKIPVQIVIEFGTPDRQQITVLLDELSSRLREVQHRLRSRLNNRTT